MGRRSELAGHPGTLHGRARRRGHRLPADRRVARACPRLAQHRAELHLHGAAVLSDEVRNLCGARNLPVREAERTGRWPFTAPRVFLIRFTAHISVTIFRRQLMRLFGHALLMSFLLVTPVLVCASEYDDCDADFIAAIGASAYQFSPAHTGELGTVRLFTILSYQRAAREGRFGFALWQLRIESVTDGTRVLTVDGRAHIGAEGAALAELW